MIAAGAPRSIRGWVISIWSSPTPFFLCSRIQVRRQISKCTRCELANRFISCLQRCRGKWREINSTCSIHSPIQLPPALTTLVYISDSKNRNKTQWCNEHSSCPSQWRLIAVQLAIPVQLGAGSFLFISFSLARALGISFKFVPSCLYWKNIDGGECNSPSGGGLTSKGADKCAK